MPYSRDVSRANKFYCTCAKKTTDVEKEKGRDGVKLKEKGKTKSKSLEVEQNDKFIAIGFQYDGRTFKSLSSPSLGPILVL